MKSIDALRNRLLSLAAIALYQERTDRVDEYRAQLAALDALIAERDAAKARAEKAEVERDALRKALEPFSDLLDGLDNEHDNAPIEIEVSIMERGVFTVGDLRRAHAALHGTAKQPKPRTCGECAGYDDCAPDAVDNQYIACGDFRQKAETCGNCGGKTEDCGNVKSHEVHSCFESKEEARLAKSRTCGECASIGKGLCAGMESIDDACNYFQPRADAQKGANE